MTRTSLSVAAATALLPLAIVLAETACPAANGSPVVSGDSSTGSDRATAVAAVEEQFAVRFCFSQYKSQPDAMACLARYVR